MPAGSRILLANPLFPDGAVMDSTPIGIERIGAEIVVTWSDGERKRYSPLLLRRACPCATCREKKRESEENTGPSLALPVISKQETVPIEIERMQPVGNYAYHIHFSDGHDSGIFPFELLYQLGTNG